MGARRVRNADTVGLLNPVQVDNIFKGLSCKPDMPELEFHGHNDLGMATANTVTAFIAGATCASVTVNGMGERAGNAPLEEVIMAMQFQQSQLLKYNIGRLTKLAFLVEKLTGQKLSATKPITGEQVFRHESGIHVNGLIAHPNAYQIIDGRSLGRDADMFVFGKHSGTNGLVHLARSLGRELNENEKSELLKMVKSLSENLKRALTMHETGNLIKQLARQSTTLKKHL